MCDMALYSIWPVSHRKFRWLYLPITSYNVEVSMFNDMGSDLAEYLQVVFPRFPTGIYVDGVEHDRSKFRPRYLP